MGRDKEVVYDNDVLQRLRKYLGKQDKSKPFIVCGDLEWKASELMDEVEKRTQTGITAYTIYEKFHRL